MSLDLRLKKLEHKLMSNRNSVFLGPAKIYCECEGIELNDGEYPPKLDRLKWNDIFGSNQLIMEDSNGNN